MKKPKDDLIGALVLKSKEGGSEGENARKALKRLCEKHDLNFDEILNGKETLEERRLEYQKQHKRLMLQIICRYILTEDNQDVWGTTYGNGYIVKATQQQYIEALHAYEVLSKLYNKERKKMLEAFKYGFYDKHNLYPQFFVGKKGDKMSEKEAAARMMGSSLSRHMEDAEINPRLEAKT